MSPRQRIYLLPRSLVDVAKGYHAPVPFRTEPGEVSAAWLVLAVSPVTFCPGRMAMAGP
jgi:hypothetical protein